MTQSWHEEELVSFAWRCTTSAHADEIISNRHDHAMAFAIERMDANLQRILSYVRFFTIRPNFATGQWKAARCTTPLLQRSEHSSNLPNNLSAGAAALTGLYP